MEVIWLVPSGGGIDLNGQHDLGFIVSPLNNLGPVRKYPYPFAIDNGAFGGKFNVTKYMALLETAKPYQARCLFIVAPDVVADAYATDLLWRGFLPDLKRTGYKLAYVAQNGVTEPPWDELDCLFIGGDTEFKLSDQVLRLLIEAKRRGKWRHVGRINSIKRMRHFWQYMDSFDGTDWCRGPAIKLKFYQAAMQWEQLQTRMDLIGLEGRGG